MECSHYLCLCLNVQTKYILSKYLKLHADLQHNFTRFYKLFSNCYVYILNEYNSSSAWTHFQDRITALADMQSLSMIEVVWLELFSFTFLWLLRTDGVTKAFSHRSHLYFLWPSCTTWMWTLSVSFLLKVASHWSHLNVLSPVAEDRGLFVRAISSYPLLCL